MVNRDVRNDVGEEGRSTRIPASRCAAKSIIAAQAEDVHDEVHAFFAAFD
jgi:hypothetical protein